MENPPKIDWLMIILRGFLFIIFAPIIYLFIDRLMGKVLLITYVISLIFFIRYLISQKYRSRSIKKRSATTSVLIFFILWVAFQVIDIIERGFNISRFLESMSSILIIILFVIGLSWFLEKPKIKK